MGPPRPKPFKGPLGPLTRLLKTLTNHNRGGTAIINLISDVVHLTPLRLDGNLPSDWSSDFPPALVPQREADNICGKWMTVGFTWNKLDSHLTNAYAPSGHAPWQVAARRSLFSFTDDHNTSNPHSITIVDFNQVLDIAADKVAINGAPIGTQEDTTTFTTYCANRLL